VILLSDENEEEQGQELLPLKVRDVMVREVITVDENASVKEAVDIMNEFQIGSLIVLEKGKAKGIVTERDFLRRVTAEAKDVVNTKVRDHDYSTCCCGTKHRPRRSCETDVPKQDKETGGS
jgi:signal-transduction protein with cAMP-binding, CBS, and nucleotidyltransferase domain